MSDEASPQKGWDSWFGPQADSSGGEENAPEQHEPEQHEPEQHEPVQQAPGQDLPEQQTQAAERKPAAAEQARAEESRPAEAETAETRPAQTQTTDARTADTRTADTQIAETRTADARTAGTQTAETQTTDTRRSETTRDETQPGEAPASASASEQVPPAPPETDAEQTNWTVPSLGAVLESDPSQATQVVPSRPASVPPPRYSAGDAEQGQARTRGSAGTPDQSATQYVPPQTDRAREDRWTPAAANPSAAPATPAAPTAPADPITPTAPPAPTWRTPQPAQMWGSAPSPPAYGRQQSGAQQPSQRPEEADDEWAGWDEAERRPSPPAPAPYNGAGGFGDSRDFGDSGGDPGARAGGDDRKPGSRKRSAVLSGVGAAGVVALATVLLMNQAGAGPAAKPSGFQPTATTVAGDAQETAAAFFAAWQSGDIQQAASYTDDPASALSALTAYKNGLNLAGLHLTAQSATANPTSAAASAPASAAASGPASASASAASSGAPLGTESGTVTFGVAAKVGLPAAGSASTGSAPGSASASASSSSSNSSSSNSSGGSSTAGSTASAAAADVTADWSYTSKLTAYQKNGGWWIRWDPALVAPNLTAGEKIVSIPIPPTVSKVTDAAGDDLSSATDPGVRNIAAALKKSAPAGQGTPGVKIELEGADGKPVAGTADVLQQPVSTGVVKTTINPTVEAAAQAAVQKYNDSSMVVIKPSTGEILAVANNDGQNDFALTARVAPGSTNKIITATALLTDNLLSSPSQAVACPPKITVNGTTFANSQGESEPAGTPFLDDFALSCNNAFGQWYDKIGSTTLAQTAQKYYGLNQKWDIGLGAAGPYYTIPAESSNGELFQELFGQGQLEAAPLAMASVAATVDSGSFKQPIVVPGAARIGATPLPAGVQQDLWQMMKAVTTQSNGTAYGVFSGVHSQVYGKTGTADVGDGSAKQQKPNSWMVVFDPTLDIAVGCVVLNAGYGASFAGPETAAVLKALQ